MPYATPFPLSSDAFPSPPAPQSLNIRLMIEYENEMNNIQSNTDYSRDYVAFLKTDMAMIASAARQLTLDIPLVMVGVEEDSTELRESYTELGAVLRRHSSSIAHLSFFMVDPHAAVRGEEDYSSDHLLWLGIDRLSPETSIRISGECLHDGNILFTVPPTMPFKKMELCDAMLSFVVDVEGPVPVSPLQSLELDTGSERILEFLSSGHVRFDNLQKLYLSSGEFDGVKLGNCIQGLTNLRHLGAKYIGGSKVAVYPWINVGRLADLEITRWEHLETVAMLVNLRAPFRSNNPGPFPHDTGFESLKKLRRLSIPMRLRPIIVEGSGRRDWSGLGMLGTTVELLHVGLVNDPPHAAKFNEACLPTHRRLRDVHILSNTGSFSPPGVAAPPNARIERSTVTVI